MLRNRFQTSYIRNSDYNDHNMMSRWSLNGDNVVRMNSWSLEYDMEMSIANFDFDSIEIVR